MTLGSVLYTLVVSRSHFNDSRPRTHEGPPDALGPHPSYEAAIALHAKLSVGVCIISAAAFISSVAVSREHMRFWAFCVYEACVGMYYPVQGMLRGRLVQDEHRATVRAQLLHTFHAFRAADAPLAVVSVSCATKRIRRHLAHDWGLDRTSLRPVRVRRAVIVLRPCHNCGIPASRAKDCARDLANEVNDTFQKKLASIAGVIAAQ